MKRRELLKAIGLGAVVAPMVNAKEEDNRRARREFDLQMTKAYIRDNSQIYRFGEMTAEMDVGAQELWPEVQKHYEDKGHRFIDLTKTIE